MKLSKIVTLVSVFACKENCYEKNNLFVDPFGALVVRLFADGYSSAGRTNIARNNRPNHFANHTARASLPK